MLKLRVGTKAYVSLEPIDGRKSIDRLSALVVATFGENPQARAFVFIL